MKGVVAIAILLLGVEAIRDDNAGWVAACEVTPEDEPYLEQARFMILETTLSNTTHRNVDGCTTNISLDKWTTLTKNCTHFALFFGLSYDVTHTYSCPCGSYMQAPGPVNSTCYVTVKVMVDSIDYVSGKTPRCIAN